MLKKIFSILLIAVLFCSFSITGYATDSDETEVFSIIGTRMVLINNYYCDLSISSSGTANCMSNISAYSGVDKVRIVMYLQKYTNGVWGTVMSWSSDYTGNYGSMTKTYSVPKGYDYRVRTYFYAYDGSTSDIVSKTTSNSSY